MDNTPKAILDWVAETDVPLADVEHWWQALRRDTVYFAHPSFSCVTVLHPVDQVHFAKVLELLLSPGVFQIICALDVDITQLEGNSAASLPPALLAYGEAVRNNTAHAKIWDITRHGFHLDSPAAEEDSTSEVRRTSATFQVALHLSTYAICLFAVHR